ncbi:MAG: T9SS type A sorting domain-containing protein [Sphingobacteriales bacterium]|nr:MAG: T9SS type A sorting domain-containing protein [Sphingobacteriales bacterium]
MKKTLSLLLLLLLHTVLLQAQDIYGWMIGNGPSRFSRYSYQNDDLTTITDPWWTAGATTDLAENYYYFVEENILTNRVFAIHNVVTNAETRVIPTKALRHPEYHNDVIWSIDSFCMYKYDVATNTMSVYDSVFAWTGKESIPPYVCYTAFNHATQTYYFTIAMPGEWGPFWFCQYHIPTKTFTKQVLPDGFLSFDYSPANDRCYFLKNLDIQYGTDTSAGIYAYEIATNTMTQVYTGWMAAASYMTLDPVKNRLFFYYETDLNMDCRIAKMACYRINSHQLDVADLSGRICHYENFEFLPTYNDTTWDSFPTSVAKLQQQGGTLKVYPVPASNTLNVAVNWDTEQSYTLTIADMMGRVVIQSAENSEQSTVDVTQLAAGAYNIILKGDKGSVQHSKFTIVR